MLMQHQHHYHNHLHHYCCHIDIMTIIENLKHCGLPIISAVLSNPTLGLLQEDLFVKNLKDFEKFFQFHIRAPPVFLKISLKR